MFKPQTRIQLSARSLETSSRVAAPRSGESCPPSTAGKSGGSGDICVAVFVFRIIRSWIPLLLTLLTITPNFAQIVDVTAILETNRIPIGSSTLLHVYAQISPARKLDADQIALWYIDLQNSEPSVAKPALASLTKPSSDKDPRTSSNGFADGPTVRGIYDSFFNLPGAGVSNRVELFQISITGVSTGKTAFAVTRGSGVPNLSQDFLVAPVGDGPPLTGGIYSTNAMATLTVIAATNVVPSDLKLRISKTNNPTPPTNRFVLTYNVAAGVNYTLEYKDSVSPTVPWSAFPGAPHNSGTFLETNTVPKRFYRVRTTP